MPNKPILVYVCSPYRSSTEFGVSENIAYARKCAANVFRVGGFAICPHLNTMQFGGLVPDDRFLEGDVELVRRAADCLFVARLPISQGMSIEIAAATERGIPIFYTLTDVEKFIRSN